MDKLISLTRADVCSTCATELPVGARAYWSKPDKVVRCVDCTHARVSEPVVSDEDLAGGSAQRQYDRRAAKEMAAKEKRVADDAKWRETIRKQRPILGRVVTTVTPKPTIGTESQSTVAWKVGAEGERRVAEVLADAKGVQMLHDRRVPGTRANIDHIAVGPSGVFVIDAKKYNGAVDVRDVGGLFRTDERLYVNRRDRTKLVDAVLWQVGVVRSALGADFKDVRASGVLCFIGADWGWRMRPKSIKDVTVLWPLALADHVGVIGELMPEQVVAIAERLRAELKPAT